MAADRNGDTATGVRLSRAEDAITELWKKVNDTSEKYNDLRVSLTELSATFKARTSAWGTVILIVNMIIGGLALFIQNRGIP